MISVSSLFEISNQWNAKTGAIAGGTIGGIVGTAKAAAKAEEMGVDISDPRTLKAMAIATPLVSLLGAGAGAAGGHILGKFQSKNKIKTLTPKEAISK